MKRTTAIIAFGASFFLFACFATRAEEPTLKKTIIELGWDIPTTEYLAKHWREMETVAPFDGIVYDLVGTTPDGTQYSSQSLFTKDAWERAWFEKALKNVQSCDFQRFRRNFIRINFYPAPFDWDDEESWRRVCEKAAICAWVARETNGDLCFDFESYGSQMFRYSAASGRAFDEMKELARKRGAQMCDAIVKELPDATILCLWMNSINFAAGRRDDPNAVLRVSGYGLLPSFIDGMLDAATPETLFVDGCENGYYMNGASEYDRAAVDMFSATGPAVALVSPENRKKYRSQVQVGFGFYLDMYSNPKGSVFYRGSEEGETRFDRLAANLRAATNASDQFVWVYGEQKRWWEPEGAKDDEWTSWESALPGATDLILELSDPARALEVKKERVLGDPSSENLLTNGDFSKVGADNRPESWGTWQIETNPTGTFFALDGAAALQKMSDGCYIQGFQVTPGEEYLVLGKVKTQGAASASARFRWNDSDGKWTCEPYDVVVAPEDEADEEGWRTFCGTAVAPKGVAKLVLLLSAGGDDAKGLVLFDDVKAFKIR